MVVAGDLPAPSGEVLSFASPEDQTVDAELLQDERSFRVPGRIRGKLSCPEGRVRLGELGAAAPVGVPEASVHENREANPRNIQIWPTGKLAAMKAIPDAESIEKTAHRQFWLSVPGSYATHRLGLRHRDPVVHDLCGSPCGNLCPALLATVV